MREEIDLFCRGLEQYQIDYDGNMLERFSSFYEMLIEKNKVMNLTSIIELRDVVLKHFLDSLSIVNCLELKKEMKIIDIGTGAGFPGIPIKIIYPQIEMVLLDSLRKRIDYLNEVIQQLRLEKVKAVHGRSEDYIRGENMYETFDLVLSRAVSNLSVLSEYCIPYVKMEGYFAAYKSEQIEEELAAAAPAIHQLGGRLTKIESFTLPESEICRKIVIIQKVKKTPRKYPRKAGLPLKEPLR